MSGTAPDAPATIAGHIRGSGQARGVPLKRAAGVSREMRPAHFFWEKGLADRVKLIQSLDGSSAAVKSGSPFLPPQDLGVL